LGERITKRLKNDAILSGVKWAKLAPKDRSTRVLSLKALDFMRDGISLTKASGEVGLNTETVRQHVGPAIYKRKRRWRAKLSDRIERQMQIYTRGRVKAIVLTNSKDASVVGQYFNDVKKALETGDEQILKKYKKYEIKDSKGKKQKLETRLNKIYEIEEAKEEPEFFEIYEV
jgi:hypothetical protein